MRDNCELLNGMINTYRKKPVSIMAMQFTGDNLDLLIEFCGRDLLVDGECIFIRSLEGHVAVSKDDYIICGIKGEFYPCKPDIFEKSYELVND